MKKGDRFFKFITLSPIVIYTSLLILLPLIYIFFLSFCKNDSYGGIIYDFTLSNYIAIFDITYLNIFVKSSLIAFIATFICICISYPFALILRERSENLQNLMTKLIMIPFLTNSLIRTYGWIVLLRKNGIVNSILITSGLIENPLSLMYNNLGIIIGMSYTLLPFMVLPVCSSVFKIDNTLIEAARDLGAKPWAIFKKIIIPETISGVFNGSLMVFIPAIGYFFISDILGGGKAMIIGNLIKNQFLTARNWPFGSAISIFLIIITFFLVWIYRKLGGKLDDLGGM
ncbi:MAG: ABC transporter permease [Bacilli bacterium]|nr:ABC transporter permease [Bacilli bacterium]